MLPYIDTSSGPPIDSDRRTQLVHLLEGPMLYHPITARPSHHWSTSTGAPSWCIYRDEPRQCLPPLASPRRSQPSLIGAPS